MPNRQNTGGTLTFDAKDVTSSKSLKVSDLQSSTPAGAVAAALARRLALPSNTPWMLRDARSRVLDEKRPIGEQIEPGERVTVAPKAHLGGRV